MDVDFPLRFVSPLLAAAPTSVNWTSFWLEPAILQGKLRSIWFPGVNVIENTPYLERESRWIEIIYTYGSHCQS